MPGKGRPFKKGEGGRPKGVPNKSSGEAKEVCAAIVDDPTYRAKLLSRAQTGKLAPAVECMLWHYAKGVPKTKIEHSGNVGMDLRNVTASQLRERAVELMKRLETDE